MTGMDLPVMPDPARLDAEALLEHAGWMRALAARLARDQAEADDASQDALAAALASPPRADRPLRPWLGRVLGNALRARRRGEQRRAAHEARAARDRASAGRDRGAATAELLGALEQQRRLADLVAELEEPYRSAILARYFRGESAARIARRTGANAATVRSHLARGRELLRARFEARLASDGRRGDAARALLAAAGLRRDVVLPLGTAAAAAKGILAVNTATKVLLASAAGVVLVGALVALDPFHGRLSTPSGQRAAARPEAELLGAESGGAVRLDLAAPGEAAPLGRTTLSQAAGEDSTDLSAAAPAAPPSVVTARVVDRTGAPVPGATLAYAEPRRPAFRGASLPSGADGHVELALPDDALIAWGERPAPATFRASAPGFALAFFQASAARAARTDVGEVELVPGGALAGVVLAASGRPVAGAEVVAADARPTGDAESGALAGPPRALGLPEARTDSAGAFRIDGVAAGPARVWARAGDGLWGTAEPVTVVPRTDVAGVLVTLPAQDGAAWIRGRVVGPDGAPMPLAVVAYAEADRFDERRIAADEAGTFRIRVEHDVPHALLAGDPDGRLGFALRRDAVAGGEVELRLPPARTMLVRVRGDRGEESADARVHVQVDDMLTGLLYWKVAGVPTRTEAGFPVAVPPGTFRVTASAPGLRPDESAAFEPGTAPAELELRLEREALFTGIVTAGGEPVAGARVVLCGVHAGDSVLLTDGFPMRFDLDSMLAGAETQRDGTFAVPARRYEYGDVLLAVDAAGYAVAELGTFPGDGTGASDLSIELVRGGAIEGRLSFPDGRDAGGRLIAATAAAGRILHVRTDADGAFRLEHLRPGPWRVEHRARETERSWSFTRRAALDALEWTCTVTDGAVARVDLVGLREATVHGVLTLDGAGAAGWSAALAMNYGLYVTGPGEEGDAPVRAVLLDANGGFAVTAAPGPETLILTSPAGAAGEVTTLLQPLDLKSADFAWSRTLSTGLLEVRVGADGAAALRLHQRDGELTRWTEIRVPAGETRTARVPAGPSNLFRRTSDGGWSVVSRLDVPAGGTARAQIE